MNALKITWGLVVTCFVIAAGYGWIMNIVKLIGSDFIWSSGMSIARLVGIFVAPLGAILGWL